MPKGLSLHIGLNNVDPECYEGWNAPLAACEADADDMYAIAQNQGFQATLLKAQEATRDSVIEAIRHAAKRLAKGDIFLLSYAGHGGQVLDISGDEKLDGADAETDADREARLADDIDETWCLYDGHFLDDELRALWPSFHNGVRILVLSDSCHSGSVTRDMENGKRTAQDLTSQEKLAIYGTETPRFRYMPRAAAVKVYEKNYQFYDAIQNALPQPPRPIVATVRLISGCRDDQLSGDGEHNGVFTGRLKEVWRRGKFDGDYASFFEAIHKGMPEDQTPVHSVIGKKNPKFDAQRPFTI